jgi:hypothetical protein
MKRLNVSGNVTSQRVFAGTGKIIKIQIWKDVDNGTIDIRDADGDNIYPQAITDYAGTINLEDQHENGCFITTASFAAGNLTVFYDQFEG